MPVFLLIFATFSLILFTLILLKNRNSLRPLRNEPVQKPVHVSILIPARNEECQIRTTVEAACRQKWDSFEVVVLDDHSGDRTGEYLYRLKKTYPEQLHIMEGSRRPAGWLGKPWACHQLAKASSGEILLFIDADVTIQPDTLSRLVASFESEEVDLITVWPRQILESFWERVLIPLIYHTLLTTLPADYVYRRPVWMPARIYQRTSRLFAAACGQFIAFRHDSYQAIGGHESVRNDILEDVALARQTKSGHRNVRMYEGGNLVSCRMYHNEQEIFQGFRKNFFAGFGYHWSAFVAAALFHLIVFLYPFLMLVVAILLSEPYWLFFSVIPVALILLHRLILAHWFGWNPLYGWTHPLAIVWYHRLAFRVLIDRITGQKALWKGRPVD